MGLILENLPTGMENISLREECLTLVKTAPAVPFITSLETLGLAARTQLKLMSPFPRRVHTCTHTPASQSLHTSLHRGQCTRALLSRPESQHQGEFDGNKETSVLALLRGFPGGSAGKESACNAGDPGSIPGSGRSPGKGIGYPLQYSWASLVAQLVGKESACNVGDLGSIPVLGRSAGEGKGCPLQYSGLENSMDWIVHGSQRVGHD